MNLEIIHPISFFNNTILQSEDIGTIDTLPIVNCITNKSINLEEALRDFLSTNISNLTNTFILRLLENNISKNEIAYIVDFYDSFDIKSYLRDSLNNHVLKNYSSEGICNIMISNIIFILNQFIQFYTMYKLVYSNEGVKLYEFLYKSTYGNDSKNIDVMDELVQNKYVFCVSILSNMLDNEIKNIGDCCLKLKDTIENIKMLTNN